MKLPKSEEKFIVTQKDSANYGKVVSGVHVEIRADDDNPSVLWYYVRADRVYDDGDSAFLYGRHLYAALIMEHALDYVAEHLTPYQEQEEGSNETTNSEDMEVVPERVPELPGSMALSGNCADSRGSDAGGLCDPGSADVAIYGQPSDRMDPGAARGSENPLGSGSLLDGSHFSGTGPFPLQCMPVPVLPGVGGAAYA